MTGFIPHYFVGNGSFARAAFVFPRDAQTYVDAEVAKGPFGARDLTITDREGRRVIRTDGHGRAILDTLEAHDEARKGSKS